MEKFRNGNARCTEADNKYSIRQIHIAQYTPVRSPLQIFDNRLVVLTEYCLPFTERRIHYLNFNVLKARSANMIDIIQNLTTIFPSFHPFNSKWW
jgi:hypothetical protein